MCVGAQGEKVVEDVGVRALRRLLVIRWCARTVFGHVCKDCARLELCFSANRFGDR